MRPITEKDVEWSIKCEPDYEPIRGNVLASGNDEEDRKAEHWVVDELGRGNQWAWCYVRVTGKWKVFTAWDVLGGCSYKSEQDFKTGGYYEDMKGRVVKMLNEMYQKALEDFSNWENEKEN